MEDIMFSYPVHGDEDDSWDIRHVWTQGRSYTISDEDGNHESCTRTEYNELWREHDALWSEYAEWVIEHGTDPLGNFLVKPSTRQEVEWVFRISNKGVRPYLVAAKPSASKAWKAPKALPKSVRDYLNLETVDGVDYLHDVATLQEFTDAAGKYNMTFDFAKCEVIFSDSIWMDVVNKNYEKELRKAAQQSVIAKNDKGSK